MNTPTDELIEAITARLAEALPEAFAEAGLPHPTEVLNHDITTPQPTKAPQVWADIKADTCSTDSRRGASIGMRSHQAEVIIAVTAAGPEPSEAARRLRKAVDVIVSVMESEQRVDDLTLWVLWRRTDYSPNFAQGTGLYKEAYITFDVNYRTRLSRQTGG